MALSNADSVKILLNGKMLAGQKVDPFEMNTFHIPYHPGKLEAIGYKNGKVVPLLKQKQPESRQYCKLLRTVKL
nr:hypothetical protein [Mucilaginibacter sp. SP1R1]